MTTPTAPAFTDAAETWNKRFGSADYIFGTEPNEWLRAHAHVWRSGQRVLCVADGEGRNSVWLAAQGLRVDAYDISAVGVAKARQLAVARGVDANHTVADCDSFQYERCAYDGVVLIFVQFADPAMRERQFAQIRGCLKPGGILILQGYTPKQLDYKTGGPPQVSHLYTEELLRQALADFEVLELREYQAELKEGDRHSGMSALIGVVARKSQGELADVFARPD